MRWDEAVAVGRKAHPGHVGRPGVRGGSLPYGAEAAARSVSRGILFFGSRAAAARARAALGPYSGHVILPDPVRGYYVAPIREVPRLHRERLALGSPRMTQPIAATQRMQVAIKALDADLQHAFSEVYVPHDLDAQREFMDPGDVRDLAHGFLQHLIASGSNSIDVQHNERVAKVEVIASFVNDDTVASPKFAPDAWVLGTHVRDVPLWQAMKAGEFTGYSFQALVYGEDVEVEVEDNGTVSGMTQPANGHTHTFTIQLAPDGRVVGGQTDLVAGHAHVIRMPSRTEIADGHRHLFDIVRKIARTA